MAIYENNRQKRSVIGCKAATTWDATTSGAFPFATSGVYNEVAILGISNNNNVYEARRTGRGVVRTDIDVTTQEFDINLEYDLTYSGSSLVPLAAFMGEDSVTSGIHSMEFQDVADASLAVAWEISSTEVMEIPNSVVTDVTLSVNAGEVATIGYNAIAERVLVPSEAVTTPSNISTCAAAAPEFEVAGLIAACNAYVRVANYSDTVDLDSGDELEVRAVNLNLVRSLERINVLRACLTKYTKKPRVSAMSVGTLELTLGKLDTSEFNFPEHWKVGQILSAEVMIAKDDNSAYIKVQLPRLKIVQLPDAVGQPDTDSAIEPVVVLEIMGDVTEARAGMTGVKFCKVEVKNPEATYIK